MRLTIDTTAKTITMDETVSLGELFKLLGEFFPEEAWKEYSLGMPTNSNWFPVDHTPPFQSPPFNPNTPDITFYNTAPYCDLSKVYPFGNMTVVKSPRQ